MSPHDSLNVVVSTPTWRTAPGIAKKWAKIKGDIKNLPKDGRNDQFGNSFTTLESVVERLEEQFERNKLLRTGIPGYREGSATLLTTLYDLETGEELSFESQAPCPPGSTMHRWGAMLTYLRRQTDVILLNLPQRDDDGNAASIPAATPKVESSTTSKEVQAAAVALIAAAPKIDPPKVAVLPKIGSVSAKGVSTPVAEKPALAPVKPLPRIGGAK